MNTSAKRRPIVLYQPRDEGAWMPLGLLALGSQLAGEHVVLVDGRFDLAPEARVAELARDASCLGVTVRTGRPLRDALRVSAAARAANPRLTVIWGGPHATYAPLSCLATGVVDGCVAGAGEETFCLLVSSVRSGRALEGIPGVTVPDAGAAAPGAPPQPERTPRALYSLLDLERHFEARGARRLDYCSSRGARELGFRGLPPDRVAADLGELAERHRLSEVVFRDEDFFADSERADAIVTALAESELRFGWRVPARPEDLLERDARLELLRRSRCRGVRVGVPSDVPSCGPLRERAVAAARRLHEAGLAARFELTIEEPGPKLRNLAATVSLARQLSALDPRFETPLRRLAAVPPLVPAAEGPAGLEAWVARSEAVWSDPRAERRLARASFYFVEGQRTPGRRLGQHLLRMLSLLRIRLGFFGLDLERVAVEASSVLRTGRSRAAPPPE